MTRTQLKAMSTRELIEHTRRVASPHETTGDLLLELADRLDDQYTFDPDFITDEATGFIQETAE